MMKKLHFGLGKLAAKALFNTKAVLVLFVLVLGLGGATYYFWNQNQKSLKLLNNPSTASEEEVKDLTSKVSKFMELPGDEKPTIITVVDKGKLADQKFFAKAENGDKVLVYTAAKQAIIYRPSTNKIITVGPVDLTPNTTFKVAVYNGSTAAVTDDLAETAKQTLAGKITNLDFLTTDVTKSKTYTKNLVVDLSGTHTTEANQIAGFINGEVGVLPATETKPDADFMIIVAK